MSHLEIEFKTLLSEENYQKLLPLFLANPSVKQDNYYFDTPDFAIKQAKMALRIRTYHDYAELTVKIPQDDTIGNWEYNQKLTLVQSQNIISGEALPEGEIKDLLTQKGIQITHLKPLGKLTTVRYELKNNIGLLALDKSYYFNTIDYELEIEVENEEKGKLAFEQFLLENDIPYQAAPSKIARFAQNL